MTHPTRRGILLALSLALIACGKKDEPVPAAADGAVSATGESEQPRRDPEANPKAEAKLAEVGAAPDLAGPFATRGLYGVPKGAPFVAVGSVKKVADALGYAALIEKYGPLIAGVTDKMTEVLGKDLFKLSSWEEIGIDITKPMGVFMPELETQAVVTFVAVADATKLIDYVTGIAKKVEAPLSSEKVGDATLFTVGDRDRGAWVVQGDMGYSVMMLRGNGAAAIAKEIVARRPEESIAMLPELKSAVAGLAADEGGVFVQLRSVLEKTVLARAARELEPPLAHYEQQLEKAKQAGDQEAITRLEATIKSEKEFYERMAARRAAEAEMLKGLVAQLSTLAVGVDISDDAVEATWRLPLTAGGDLAGLMRNASDSQLILKATKTEPLFLLSGQVDPDRYYALLQKAMAAEGDADDFAELKAVAQKEFGIDIDKDIIGQLTGELGIAVTGDVASIMKSKDPQAELGGTLVIGVKSDESWKALVSKLSSMDGVSEVAKWDAGKSALTVSLPGMQPLQVVFGGTRILASTDLETAARLAGADSFVSTLANPKLKAIYEKKDLAALFSLSQSFMSTMFMGMSRRGSYLPPMPSDATAEQKAAYAELVKLDSEIEPLRVKVEDERMKPAFEMFGKLGMQAATVTMDGSGAVGSYGLYPKGATVPEVLAGMIDMALAMNDSGPMSEDEKRLRELEDKRWKLESDLWSKRAQPIDPPLEPKGPGTP